MGQDFLLEQIKTIRNLCDIAILIRNVGKDELLPTVLELLYQEAQSITLAHCVKEIKDV